MKGRKRTSVVWKFTDEEFQKLIDESSSGPELCEKIGIHPRNGSVKTIYARIRSSNFSFDKFKENKKNKPPRKTNLEFIKESNSARKAIKEYIIKNNLIAYECSSCYLKNEWNGKILSLQLEHKNGINNDNRLENLTFLCPNCHSQTDTYAGKSLKTKIFRQDEVTKIPKVKESVEERQSRIIRNRKFDPTKEELQILIDSRISMVEIGEKFGVSDNAVRKRCKLFDIEFKKRKKYIRG